jgi:hypothetical protein
VFCIALGPLYVVQASLLVWSRYAVRALESLVKSLRVTFCIRGSGPAHRAVRGTLWEFWSEAKQGGQ